MIDFIRKHLILNVFFLFLGVCLFLGDGQQMLIDVVGAGGVLVFILVAFLYGKRQRELPLTPTLLLGGTIFYFCIRTIFSDDIGYSVYTTVRMVEAFIIFYILYCFTTDEDRKVFPTYLLGFCIFSLFASIVYIFTPILSNTLTKSNLLVPTYGHNNVVDILLFGIPIAFFQLIFQKKPLYLYIIMFLLFGIIFSFSRTAMMIIVLFLVISLLFYWKKVSLKKRLFLGFFFFSILGILSLLLVIPQTVYKRYVPVHILPKMTKQVDGAGNRFEYFRQAIEAIKERPLFGSGPGTFLLQSKRFQKTPDSYSRYAHNVLLQELTEVGVIGTSLLLLFLLWCFIHIWKAYNREEKPKQYLLTMLASGVVLQILNASFDFSLNFFVVQLLVVSTLAVMTSFGNQKDKTVSFLGAFILTPSLILVFLFYLITSICSMGLRKYTPLLSSCCYLSEFFSTEFLKETDVKFMSDQELRALRQFHISNSDIQCKVSILLSERQSFADAQKAFNQCLVYDPYKRYSILRDLIARKKNDSDPTYDDQIFELLISNRNDRRFDEVALSYEDKTKLLHIMQIYDPIETSYTFSDKENAFFYYVLAQLYINQFDLIHAQSSIEKAVRFDETNALYQALALYISYVFTDIQNSDTITPIQKIVDQSDMNKPFYVRNIIAELSYRVSQYYFVQENNEQARYYNRKAITFYPWREEYYVQSARLFLKNNDKEMAKTVLNSCLEAIKLGDLCKNTLTNIQ